MSIILLPKKISKRNWESIFNYLLKLLEGEFIQEWEELPNENYTVVEYNRPLKI